MVNRSVVVYSQQTNVLIAVQHVYVEQEAGVAIESAINMSWAGKLNRMQQNGRVVENVYKVVLDAFVEQS